MQIYLVLHMNKPPFNDPRVRRAQGALLERTPQDSMIVSRPPTVRQPAASSLQAEQLGLFAAPQSA